MSNIFFVTLFVMCMDKAVICSICEYKEETHYYYHYRYARTINEATCYDVTSEMLLDFNDRKAKLSEKLTIDEGSIVEKLPANSSLSELLELKILILKNLNIEEISPGAFNGLQKLEEMDLSVNRLEMISVGVFNNLKNLQKLYLQENQILSISKGVFDNLRHLELLDLSVNLISDIENASFVDLVNLRILILRQNNITVLRENLLKNSTSLQNLWLSKNPLKEFQDVGFSGSLLGLEASKTALRQFNLNLSHCVLDYVNFAGSRLEEFDFALLNSNLRSVDLSYNRLKAVKNINVTEGRLISLNNNEITELDGIFPFIQFLALHHNKIKHFEANSSAFYNYVQVLDLAFNQIEDASCFGFESLINLKLRNNHITVIKENAFIECSTLKNIDLSFNKIKNLESSAFGGLISLKNLDISNNHIENLTNDSFVAAYNLECLFFNNNRIRSMDVQQILEEVLTVLTCIKVGANSFSCDDLYSIFKVLRKYHVKCYDEDYINFDECRWEPVN